MNSNKRNPKILLRSSWQIVNIGDIAHTPGVLALLEEQFPEAEVILWASQDLSEEVMEMEHKRFPNLQILKGTIDENGKASNRELGDAIDQCDFLLHGSGPFFVACRDVAAFVKHTGKPFGVFGITYNSNPEYIPTLNQAQFIYFRDSVSLEAAKKDGVCCPIMEFGPDGAFSTDLRDDANAEKFLKENDLQEGQFVCCIGRYRWTPYWNIRDVPFDPERHALNEEKKENDHAPLREAIIRIARETQLKVLLCPEDCTQMAVGKEMIYDKLPEDVKSKVVWKEDFWLTDEALSVYVRSVGLFGNEMHSPIMCIGNGIPAIVCRFDELTSKGYMWPDIGLGDWFFDMDIPQDRERLPQTVINMLQNTEETKQKAAAALKFVRQCQNNMVETLKRTMGL